MIVDLIDNYLSKQQFVDLQTKILGPHFPWYFNEYTLSPEGNYFSEDKNSYQFTHSLFNANRGPTGEWFNLVVPILQKLVGSNLIINVKANLNPRDTKHSILGNFHTDVTYQNAKTAIFYCNTNNGYTEFADGTIVESVANRLVIFDADQMHVGYSCTDEKKRVLLNFNYITTHA